MNNLEILKTGIENFGLEATEEKLQNLKKYREILVEWNKVMNLTGIEEEREVYIKHFLDSITAVTNNKKKDDNYLFKTYYEHYNKNIVKQYINNEIHH